MLKQILFIGLAFGTLLALVYGFQVLTIDDASAIRFDFKASDVFFSFSSYAICLHLLLFSRIEKLRPQLGFIYLPTLFIKGILFYVIFKDSIFSIDNLTLIERLNLLIPLLIFLILEVYVVAKIINKKQPKI